MIKHYTGIGSRKTPQDICDLMTTIASYLTMFGWTLRSGGAEGADTAFQHGSQPELTELWLPWPKFSGLSSPLLPTPAAFEMAEKYHPAWHLCSRGARALLARNCHQVLGADLATPSKFVICWTANGGFTGGTGQALRIAHDFKIPIYNLYFPEMRDYIPLGLSEH